LVKNNIDLSKKFNIQGISLFRQLGDSKYKSALSIEEINERILNSCMFSGKISVEQDQGFQCGLVRASIAELVSIEELPVVKLHNAGKPFRLNTTEHPLLCIVKELRNLQMHLSSVQLSEFSKDLLCGRPDKPENAIPVTRELFFINNLKVSDFESLRNYNNYDVSQFKEALTWFDAEQKEWGISELLEQASYVYAESLSNMIENHVALTLDRKVIS